MPRIRRRCFFVDPAEIGVYRCIWLQLMGQFSRLFRRAAGRPQSRQREREERGCQVMQGIRHMRAIFV